MALTFLTASARGESTVDNQTVPFTKDDLLEHSQKTASATSSTRPIRPRRRSKLKQPEDFEDDHDDDNHSNYVKDVSAHAGDSYQIERAMLNTCLNLSSKICLTIGAISTDKNSSFFSCITRKGRAQL
jgi:hypothetical protein